MCPPSMEACCSHQQAEQRVDCINQLVALCVRNNRNPYTNAFADFVIKVCWKRFGYGLRISHEYIDTLLIIWHFDLWKSKVMDNLYLSDEEKQAWAGWVESQ